MLLREGKKGLYKNNNPIKSLEDSIRTSSKIEPSMPNPIWVAVVASIRIKKGLACSACKTRPLVH